MQKRCAQEEERNEKAFQCDPSERLFYISLPSLLRIFVYFFLKGTIYHLLKYIEIASVYMGDIGTAS